MGFEIEKKSSNFFRNLGFSLMGGMILVLFVVMYMALSRATIIVEPKEEVVNADLLVTVKEKNLQGGDLLGKIDQITVSTESSFNVSGKGTEMPAKATGEIVVYNNSTKNQALIATTRFLSKDGVLFRLKSNVTLPAGKSATVQVYADKEGKSGEITATAFTIPGLAKDLQSKIYGKSTTTMTGGIKTIAVVTQKDIDDAVENLLASLLVTAAENFKASSTFDAAKFSGPVYANSIIKQEVSAKAGDKTDSFKVKLELKVVGIAYDSALQDQAAQTLSNMINTGRELLSSNIAGLKPVIDKYDLLEKTATLKITLSGNTILTSNSSVFDREKLAGMKDSDAKQYLAKYAGVKSVDIKYFPFWLDRIPKLRDHIKVVVK